MLNAINTSADSPAVAKLPRRTPGENIKPDQIFAEMPGARGAKYAHPADGALTRKFVDQFNAYLDDHGLFADGAPNEGPA